MRVALDVSAVPARPAGAGRYIVELASRVGADDVSLSLVTQKNDGARWREWSPASHIEEIVPRARPSRLLYEAFVLGHRAPALGDVWHGPHYTMPRHRRTPTVVTFCDMTFFTNPEWHESSKVVFFRRAMAYAARHADEIISISRTTTDLIQEILEPSIPVTTIPLGVDHSRFSLTANGRSLTSAGLPHTTPYILFLGTWEPRKGLDVLLDAFRDVASSDADVELWLAGQSGWHVEATRTQIAHHPFRDRIRPLGYVDDDLVPTLMHEARVVAYPSRGEGFGLPVLEALACGAEVVTTKGTVMEEVAGDAATFVPVGDSDALATSITSAIYRNDEERQVRAQLSARRAQLFTWDATAAHHRDVYRRLGN
ncbi:MAG: glycosyltransferase family 4 protein [Acidobacteria bacterium]|nr:glycosyltransferase family 4 protein [Acidobacteriota bacterium]